MHPTRNLETLLPFAASVIFGLLAWGVVCLRYIWPRMREQPLPAAVRPILYLHLFRYVGLAFTVPGVAGPNLQAAFASSAAYGDLTAMALAYGALIAGASRYARALIWAFGIWGFTDILFAFYQAVVGVGVDPASFGAAWYLPTLAVPLLLWTHLLVFAMLIRNSRSPSPGALARRLG